jgi:hypothetical protein
VIFAGALPSSSPDTLWTTHSEPQRWRAHWTDEGILVTGSRTHRVKGRQPHDHLVFGNAAVNGVVVNAVDDLMHTSELLGDEQLLANLDVSADNGFLTDLVARATTEGIETWITADHGNLECFGSGSIRRRRDRIKRQAPAALPEPYATGRLRSGGHRVGRNSRHAVDCRAAALRNRDSPSRQGTLSVSHAGHPATTRGSGSEHGSTVTANLWPQAVLTIVGDKR